MTVLQILLGLLTLVTNAFFVGAEFALVSVRRSQIEPAAERGDRRARRVLWGLEHVSVMMATAQLGITVSSLVLGAVAEPAVAHLLTPLLEAIRVPHGLVHPIAFVVALTIATYLHMLFGEMVPKNVALAAPERTALALGPGLVSLTRALRPAVLGVNGLANVLLRLLRVDVRGEVAAAFTGGELSLLVDESRETGLLAPGRSELLHDALELGERPVADVVLPWTRIVCADRRVTPRQLERLAATSGFSRFPVTGEGGEILGYLHVKDALEMTDRDHPFPDAALRPIARVAADTRMDDVITAMRRSGAHLAAVTDRHGRLTGLVTMEDVLRELVGEAGAD